MNKTSLAFLGISALLLIGLFLLFRPAPQPQAQTIEPVIAAAPATVPTVPVVPVVPAGPAEKAFGIAVEQGRRVAGPALIRVWQGTPVTLRIRSDRDDQLHLHGYDLSLELHAGKTGELRFTADRSGRFEYELHTKHVELGVLEVLPR
jgi:hypothetical protein